VAPVCARPVDISTFPLEIPKLETMTCLTTCTSTCRRRFLSLEFSSLSKVIGPERTFTGLGVAPEFNTWFFAIFAYFCSLRESLVDPAYPALICITCLLVRIGLLGALVRPNTETAVG